MESINDIYGWFLDPVGWAAAPADPCAAQAKDNNAAFKGKSCSTKDKHTFPCTAIPCSDGGIHSYVSECQTQCGWSTPYTDCLMTHCPVSGGGTADPHGAVGSGAVTAGQDVSSAVNQALGPISKFFQPCNLGGTAGKPLFQLPVPCWFGGLLVVLVLLVLIRH